MRLLRTLMFAGLTLSKLEWKRNGLALNSTALLPFCGPIVKDDLSDQSQKAEFTQDQLWQLQVNFWNRFMSPANAEEAKSINSSLLAPNVQGRVDVTRTFEGQELNTEYLFGLFANLQDYGQVSLLGYPVSYEIVHFVGNGDIVSASTVVQFKFASMDQTLPVMIDTWNQWNAQCQVIQYDVTFCWFEWLVDTLMGSLGDAMNKTAVDIQSYLTEALANSICSTHETSCLDGNKQWNSRADCHQFLTSAIRFGEAYELGRNTLLCRMVHQNMVPLRPALHCPHIGPTGGGMCDDGMGYVDKVEQKYFTNAPLVPTNRTLL